MLKNYAQLSVECIAGQVFVKLQFCLGQCSLPTHQHHPSRPPRHPGPSRLRRRARLAKAAAQAATTKTNAGAGKEVS